MAKADIIKYPSNIATKDGVIVIEEPCLLTPDQESTLPDWAQWALGEERKDGLLLPDQQETTKRS